MATKKTEKAEKAEETTKTYRMPVEVSDWIARAESRMNHLQSEVNRLKTENAELKAYRAFAEKRILRSEAE